MSAGLLRRYSMLWRLALLLVVAIFLTMVLGNWLTGTLRNRAQDLGPEAKTVLRGYAAEAEQAWTQGGERGIAIWLATMADREQGEIMVVDARDQSLSGNLLTERQRAGLRFQRSLNGKMSFRYGRRMPYLGIPFPGDPSAGRLIIQLPPRFRPGTYWPVLNRFLLVGIPVCAALVIGALLFWRTRVPLLQLRRQVLAFKENPAARIDGRLRQRDDEFGELARSFNRMADKVSAMLVSQRQLLNDMSHELRTPLSRLAVALESDLDEAALRRRVASELTSMQQLVDDSLALGWHETQAGDECEDGISLAALWEIVTENASFESGWSLQRFPCELAQDAQLKGNLNALARVFENLVRNAVRHSPAQGTITLTGERVGDMWHLAVTDQGPGVPEDQLETIFSPFVRLDSARAKGGFGLGLSIAIRTIEGLGGEMWAENAHPGLRVQIRVPAA